LLLNQGVWRNRIHAILAREDTIHLGFGHPRREDLLRTSGDREAALAELGLAVPNPHVAIVAPLVRLVAQAHVSFEQIDHLALADTDLAGKLDEAVERFGRHFVIFRPKCFCEYE